MAALKAGKHLWIEKPMTETSLQARKLVDEAANRNRVLFVDHTFIYTGAVRKMGDVIASGDLGRVYYYDSTRVNLGLFQRDVNVIADLAVHDFSILDDLLKEHPVAVSASGTNLPELHLDIHVHSQNAGERFVFVNMRKYQEGETLKEGPSVERITAEGVILNQRGLRFLLPRN